MRENSAIFQEYEELSIQMQESYKEIDLLKKEIRAQKFKNTRIEKELAQSQSENKKLKQENLELLETNAQLSKRNAYWEEFFYRYEKEELLPEDIDFLAKLKLLDSEISQRLEAPTEEVTYDSHNTSLPPSSDEIRRLGRKGKKKSKNHNYNSREKSTRKKGAQKGHKGKTLSFEDAKHMEESGEVKVVYETIGERIEGIEPKRRIVLDLEITPVARVIEIYGPIPKELHKCVVYGSVIRSLIVMLYSEGQVSVNRIKNLINQMSGLNFNVSEGSIYNYYLDFVKASSLEMESIIQELITSEVLMTDATKFSTREGNSYVRNHSNGEAVCYTALETKSMAELWKTPVLPGFFNIIVHDHEIGLYQFSEDGKHGDCNAHLGRDLQRITDETHHQWAKELLDLLNSVNKQRNKLKGEGKTQFKTEQTKEFEEKVLKILKSGWKEFKNPPCPCEQKMEEQVLKRLTNPKYRDAYLHFIYDFNVPFTNNQSERDLRKIVNKRQQIKKFGFFEGLIRFCEVMSVSETLKKKGVPQLLAFQSIIKRNAPYL